MKSQSGLFENQCTELTVLKMGEDLFRFTSFNLGESIALISAEDEFDGEYRFCISYRNEIWHFRYQKEFDEWSVWTAALIVNGQFIPDAWKAITRQQIINGEFYNVR